MEAINPGGRRLPPEQERRYIILQQGPQGSPLVSLGHHSISPSGYYPQMTLPSAVASPQTSASIPTFFAFDAETGRPVRVMGLQPVAPVSAPGPADASLVEPRANLYRQHPLTALTSSLERHQLAALHQQQQQQHRHIPLFMLDPHAPIQDLAAGQQISKSQRSASPPLVQDAYSFSQAAAPTASAAGSFRELATQRAREQQRAQLLVMQQQQQQQQQQQVANVGTSDPFVLSAHLPPSHLARHQAAMQQLQHSSLPQKHVNPVRRNSSSSTAPSIDPNEPKVTVLQDLPAARPGEFPAVMFCEADEERLTSYQCLLRKQLELFEADEEDVRYSTRQGRTAPIKVGQVGVRCRHCSAPGMAAKTKGASYYSQTIEGVYQIAQNMSKVHLCEKCLRIPHNIKHKLNIYRTDCRRAIKGKEYWSEHIKSLGVYEDHVDGCLRVRRKSGTKIAVAASPRITTANEGVKEENTKIVEETDRDNSKYDHRHDRDDAMEEDNGSDDENKREQTAINAVLGIIPEVRPTSPLLAVASNIPKDAASDSDTATEDDEEEYDLSMFRRPRGKGKEEDEEDDGSTSSVDDGSVI